MTQKRRKVDSGKVIGETTALRWESTHVTKPNPRVAPLQLGEGMRHHKERRGPRHQWKFGRPQDRKEVMES